MRSAPAPPAPPPGPAPADPSAAVAPSLAAPLRAPGPALHLLGVGRASRTRVLRGWGPRRCGAGSGPGPRDYFSFESFRRPKVWSVAAEGSGSVLSRARRQLTMIYISIAKEARGEWGKGSLREAVPREELGPGMWGGAAEAPFGGPWEASSGRSRALGSTGCTRGRNFKPLRDRAQTPVAVKVGALDPEGWWYQGHSLCKGGSGCPQGGILGPMPDAWPDGLRTSSPRRAPPLDAPWSLSCPFSGASSLRSPAKHPWAEQTWC